MKNIVTTLGITGCGKSSWLKDKNPVVETDDLRVELLDDIDDYTEEGLIFSTAAKRMAKLFDTHDIVYYFVFTSFMLFLTIRSLESRRWR